MVQFGLKPRLLILGAGLTKSAPCVILKEKGDIMGHSWQDMANLTHKTQVEEFNFCLCEEQEMFPYEDCSKC